MIKRLIFDVDGTLITGVDFVSSIARTLERLGCFSDENLKKFLEAIPEYEKMYNNYNRRDYIEHFEKYLGVNLGDRFFGVFFDELKGCVPKENHKLKTALVALSENFELVLLTNYFGESQLNRLNTIGIGNLFSEYYGEELIKPNDDIYLRACGKHSPSECVMIGDDLYLDVKKAYEMGLHGILVNSKKLDFSNSNILVVDKVEDITVEMINSLGQLEKWRR